MIAIIDYGMGNLRSVQKAFETVGHPAVVTRSAQVIRDASHVVLPGVGAFPDCMRHLEEFDLVDPVRQAVASGKPFMGICLGLQLLFAESEEFGVHKGLGILRGRVVRFPVQSSSQNAALKVPHMGWNNLTVTSAAPPLQGLAPGSAVYFVHSYYVVPDQPEIVATTTDYGGSFCSSVWRDNIFACQFHPEKSQAVGLAMIRAFGAWR
ncbi:MAG: imidazole glycerol phosphate synthase subunit HisH [Nitrospiraceae bacterium]